MDPHSMAMFFVFISIQLIISTASTLCVKDLTCILERKNVEKILSMKPVIPALYVFGDSVVDSGNNNYLETLAKANSWPYGIDFNNTQSGRFTNGLIMPDMIAQIANLPFPPPYLGISKEKLDNITTGINFASASCGILHDTGKIGGTCLYFDKQMSLFKNTVRKTLKRQFKSSELLLNYMSTSLFYFNIGGNDIILNYFQKSSTLSTRFSPKSFGKYISRKLCSKLKSLYKKGARKFLVSGIGQIGCIPGLMNSQDATDQPGKCNEKLNELARYFNSHLLEQLHKLQVKKPDSIFVYIDFYKFFTQVRSHPQLYGFDYMENGCYRNGKLCESRQGYFFFDEVHPTEDVYCLIVKQCLMEPSICAPISLEKLLFETTYF